MKAIMILDEVPDSCQHCPCFDNEYIYCNLTHKSLDIDIYCNSRISECPLKELPKKLPITADIDYITGYNTGWNDCIEHMEED